MPVTMPSSNLPAASLSTLVSFPAGRPRWSISNYLKYIILSSIIRRFSGRNSRFLPALREARVGGHSSCPPVALSVASAPAVAVDRPPRLTPFAIAGPQCNQQSGDQKPVSDGRRHRDDPDQHQECGDQRQRDDEAHRQGDPENGDEQRQQYDQEGGDDHPDDEVEEAHRSFLLLSTSSRTSHPHASALQRSVRVGHGDEMIESGPTISHAQAAAPCAAYTVTVRGLVLMCSIGIRRREREQRQRVRVSVDLVAASGAAVPDAATRST